MKATFIKPWPTFGVPTGTLSIADTVTHDYLGFKGGTRRKSFIITNLSSTNTLYVNLGTSGTSLKKMIGIPPSQVIQLETDSDLQVYNNSGGTITYIVCEFFFVRDVPDTEQ